MYSSQPKSSEEVMGASPTGGRADGRVYGYCKGAPSAIGDLAVVVPTPATATAAAAPLSEWQLFGQLLPAAILNSLDPKPPQAVYTPHVVTWLLVYQRLHDNATLNDAVAELLFRFPKESLPDCNRARERSMSANTGAYGQARVDL